MTPWSDTRKPRSRSVRLEELSTVLPAYNEEGNIADAVERLLAVLPRVARRHEVIVVDDGSRDRTGEIADQLASANDEVRVIHHRPNRGYGAALWSGFRNAGYRYVFYTDADNQYDVSEIARLVPLVRDYDIVVGYRAHRRDGAKRKLFSWGFKQFVKLAFDLPMRDVDCAFKLFRREVFDAVEIESNRFFVDAEVMAKARKAGLKFAQVPVTHFPRRSGTTTTSVADVPRTLREAWRVWKTLYVDGPRDKGGE